MNRHGKTAVLFSDITPGWSAIAEYGVHRWQHDNDSKDKIHAVSRPRFRHLFIIERQATAFRPQSDTDPDKICG